mmetsp:Transcript_9152/g.17450  ORF Transcript_9152/g.17450 Transcript_9152/m.17450 type:complete len:136 (+) Transcript_9152:546-953(+)|eukprot:scaffold3947_cov179-Amphora_coffeaeformis.AAC.7
MVQYSLEASFEEYATLLRTYLDYREEHTLVLMRAYFTLDEVKAVGQESGRPAGASGSFVHCNVGPDTFCLTFMVQHNMPWFVWYLTFWWPLKEFHDTVLSHVRAVLQAVANGEDTTESTMAEEHVTSSAGVMQTS